MNGHAIVGSEATASAALVTAGAVLVTMAGHGGRTAAGGAADLAMRDASEPPDTLAGFAARAARGRHVEAGVR
jgi:hypothetical protein